LTNTSSTAATYNTPASVTSSLTVTVTASSVTDTTKSAAVKVVVNPPLSVTTPSLASGLVGTAYSATLDSSGGTPPVTWTLASGASLPPGLSLSSAGAISGVPTVAAASSFTVVATDSVSPTPQTAQHTYSITVAALCGSGNESVLSGQYAFSLAGSNGTGFQAVAGAFTADGKGKITAGEADTNGLLGPSVSNIDPTNSSYSVGTDNLGCATISTTFGTFTTRFALGSIVGAAATQGRIIEFEPASSSAYIASGEILQQNPSSFGDAISSNYVWGSTGWDANTSKPAAVVGVMDFNAGQIPSYEMVVNDGGSVIYTPTGTITGTYSSFDAQGRGTLVVKSPDGPATAALYKVSASRLLCLTIAGNPVAIGEMQQQTAPSGGFTGSSVSGNMVLYGNGASGASAGDAFVELVNSTGSGSLTLSMYEDNGAGNTNNGTGWQSLQTANTFTCSYSIAANGRMNLSGSDPNCTVAPVVYLTGANTGLLVGQGTSAQSGGLEPQATLAFNNNSLSGKFFVGPAAAVSQKQQTEVDEVTLGNGSATSIGEITSTTSQEVDNSSAMSYTVNADGTVTTVNSGVPIVRFIIIRSGKFVMINNVTDPYPYLVISQQ
jgi:hypothetical protein